MNTNKLKSYAPKARVAFMQAVTKRAAMLGLYEDRIRDVTIQGDSAIIEGRIFTLNESYQRKQLVKRIKSLGTVEGELNLANGFKQFINETAFTWFNRLTAIRYMEVNGYLDHGFRVLSKSENATFDQGFEILSHAADVADDLGLDKPHIVQLLLDGDQEEALYREILLGQCQQLSKIMPLVFGAQSGNKLENATGLLLPDNLTKTDSILKALINDLPEECWRDFDSGTGQIEVIGWLYQFYISEHKDAVIGKVVKREDIPAATQLFTPNWIVKYLVQNSLGRQWLATYPESTLKDKMEYYITPAEQSDDVIKQLKALTPTSIDPESIKVLDPAAGSGHILVEVYQVLREIYLERGYRLREIPELILTKNIYGLDIDDRAAQLAAFALMMKAREDDRRIFQRVEDGEVQLNVYSLQSTGGLDIGKLWQALNLEGNKKQGSTGGLFDGFDDGSEGFSQPIGIYKEYFELLQTLKFSFLQAKTLGSLIQIDNEYLQNLVALKELLQAKEKGSDPSAKQAVRDLMPVVNQSICLAQKYDGVIANPPYMNIKSMNSELSSFVKKQFPISKSDLFSLFLERSFYFLKSRGINAQVTMQSWMFLSSYNELRELLIKNATLYAMAHLGPAGFDGLSKNVVQTTCSIFGNTLFENYKGTYDRLVGFDGSENKKEAFLTKKNRYTEVSQKSFLTIPYAPINYWMKNEIRDLFTNNKLLKSISEARKGLSSTDNDRFVRLWFEPNIQRINFEAKNKVEAQTSNKKWFPFHKGGENRRWFGNNEYVVNWENDGEEIKEKAKGASGGRIVSESYYFRECVAASCISSNDNHFRFYDGGGIIDTNFRAFFDNPDISVIKLIGLLNSKVSRELISYLSPTLALNKVDLDRLPIVNVDDSVEPSIKNLVGIAKEDWDSSEESYNFKHLHLIVISRNNPNLNIQKCIGKLYEQAEELIDQVLRLEEQVDEFYSQAYNVDLSDKYTTKKEDITLKQNPSYIALLTSKISGLPKATLFSNIKVLEVLSFFVGIAMGRYSLDRDGLVYARSGNDGFKELVAEGAFKTFPADDDGIIPLASEEWLFDDDATARFKTFVKTVWGQEHLAENLDFVAQSLCLHALKPLSANKGGGEGSLDTIRRYFSTKFYKDHLKTYKKRPIYWLFSSGKQKAFECLVYLHRYNESTLARMRTEYVTPLMGKMETQLSLLAESASNASSPAEKNRLNKELKSLQKKQAELRTFDEELKHYSELKIKLDLDDGVKVNYGKFGNPLFDVKAIHGKKPEIINDNRFNISPCMKTPENA